MDDNLKINLEVEGAVGEQYQGAWDRMVKPFFEKKQAELYEVFQECPIRDKDGLVEIHAQHKALKSMEDEFLTFINSGKLARQQLADEPEASKEKGDNDE